MHNMKRIGYVSCLALMAAFTIFGCSVQGKDRVEISSNSKKITLLNTSPTPVIATSETTDNFSVAKIDKLEGLRGEDWINDEIILATKENSGLDPIHVFDSMENIRNLYTYNLKTGKEKLSYDAKEYLTMPIVSPDKKHIFVQNPDPTGNKGLILDQKGSIVATISPDNLDENLYLSYNNAKWINNDTIIVPDSKEGVCLIGLNSSIDPLDNIDLMQTDTAVMVEKKIYYISTDRNLMSYDITSKQKEVVNQNVLNFELSPKKDKFAIEKKLEDGKNSLVIIDLTGKELETTAEGKTVFGMSWSDDQRKLAYLLSSDKESETGLYIVDLESKNNIYVSPDFMGIDNGLRWNPSGNKIMASMSEVIDMKLVDSTYIITLNQ